MAQLPDAPAGIAQAVDAALQEAGVPLGIFRELDTALEARGLQLPLPDAMLLDLSKALVTGPEGGLQEVGERCALTVAI